MIVETIASVLILLGAFFVLLGSVGMLRLPDIFTRLHGPTKATTLGVGAILVAASLADYAVGGTVGIKALTVLLFLFITAPVSAHLLAKTALADRKRSSGQTGRSPKT